MPFRSEAQRKFMWKHHPDIAAQWMAEFPDQDLSLLPPSVGGKKKTKTDNNSNAAHSMEKEAMSDERDRILYNLYMNGEQPEQEKSAGLSSMRNAIGAAAAANAASRADQIGIALGTSVTAGITNNYVHDTLVERRKQKKEKELSQAADMEKINLTLADIQHKLHSSPQAHAPETEKAASWLDALHPKHALDWMAGMNKDVVKISEGLATNGEKKKQTIMANISKLEPLIGEAKSHVHAIQNSVVHNADSKLTHAPFVRDILNLLPQSIDFHNLSGAIGDAGDKLHDLPGTAMSGLTNIETQLKRNLAETLVFANAGDVNFKKMIETPVSGNFFGQSLATPTKRGDAIRWAFSEWTNHPYSTVEQVAKDFAALPNELKQHAVEHMYDRLYKPLLNGVKGDAFNKTMAGLNSTINIHNHEAEIGRAADIINGGASHIAAAKAAVRKGEMRVAGLMAAPHVMEGISELVKYPSWRRGAIKETAAINQALQAAEKSKTFARRAGIAGALGVAGALAGGAIYNKVHDPINPLSMPSLPSLPTLHIPDSIVNLFKGKHTKVTAHPSGKMTIESSPSQGINRALPPPGPDHPLADILDQDDGDDSTPDWMRKASSESSEIVEGAKGVGGYVKDAWKAAPLWHKVVAGAGVAGAGYLAHDAVKTYGADTLLAHANPALHHQTHTLKHQLRLPEASAPIRHGMHPLAKYGVGAAALLGAGYLYNKAYPSKDEDQYERKAANYMSPAVAAELNAARQAAMQGRGKALGIGLLAGLAIPTIGKGLASAYNMVQQNKIQRDMVAIQQMQAASQMGMGGMMGGMGYTNPVALQQSTLY